MPFAIIADGESMKKWGIRSGSRVVINPVEDVQDFDIALVCYKDNLVLKKLRRMRDGSIDLISADGSIITVPADDVCVPDLFAIWGKAMTYTYKESGKVKHGL
jgi:SOS-response transcriptional repressor LexA